MRAKKSTAIYKRLGTNDSTLKRAREYHGLLPWPGDPGQNEVI